MTDTSTPQRSLDDTMRSFRMGAITCPGMVHRITLSAPEARVVADSYLAWREVQDGLEEIRGITERGHVALAALLHARKAAEGRFYRIVCWLMWLSICVQVNHLALQVLSGLLAAWGRV